MSARFSSHNWADWRALAFGACPPGLEAPPCAAAWPRASLLLRLCEQRFSLNVPCPSPREGVRVEKAVKDPHLCSFSGKSKEAEIKRINKELANIRSKFKGKCGRALL